MLIVNIYKLGFITFYHILFRWLALSYANYHADMANPNRMPCRGGDKNFGKEGGITNGAKWYSVRGGKI